MRTNYVLTDFENIQPEEIRLLAQENFHVCVFVGANQNKIGFDLVRALQPLGERAEYVKISGNGPNALDFHIAYLIGELAAKNSQAFFHIISADKGFDPLITFLKEKRNLRAARVKLVAEIALLKGQNLQLSAERITLVLERLTSLKNNKPRTVKTLINCIKAIFQNQLDQKDSESLLQSLVSKGFISLEGTKVQYLLPKVAAA